MNASIISWRRALISMPMLTGSNWFKAGFVTLILLLTPWTAYAEHLAFTFSDPAGDHAGSVDIVNMVFDFENQTGDYLILLTADAANPFSGDFRININLFNPGVGTTACDPAFFQDTVNDFVNYPNSVSLTLTGSNLRLLEWNSGDQVAISNIPFGFPDCGTFFSSSVIDIPFEPFLEDAIAFEDIFAVITETTIFQDGFEDPSKNTITTLYAPGMEIGEQNSIAIAADGFPVISFHDRTSGSLQVAKCKDVACVNDDEIINTVDDPDNKVGWYNSIAIGADTFPVISYHDESGGTLKVAKCNDTDCAGHDETITILDGSVTDVGDYTSIAIGTDTFPVISYYDRTSGNLKVVKCNDVACVGDDESFSTVDASGNVGPYSSLAIGTDGLPVIAYYHSFPAEALKVAKCNDAACAGGDETITTVDGLASSVGQYISLVIGNDGFPVISYHDFSPALAMKVAKCNDSACAGNDETVTTVDDPLNSVGAWTSMAIGTDGFPIISYYDSTAGDLKVAKCNDFACTGGGETITTVDHVANVGLLSSIAIGADGLPIISYQNNTTKTLKILHCGAADCRP